MQIVGRDSYFYILHFNYMEDLNHICNNSPWAVDGAMFVLEKWRPNLVLERLQLNFIAVWVQLHGLPIEYQYPELAEKMGMLMGIVERVDWEDRIPRNIRFMRVRVQVNPWMPVITGFTLKLDDGSKTCIQCKYERVHKLCNRFGLIRHTRSQCTQSMEDVEMMLFRQRYRIQNLHQVQYNFDALEPHFSNNLRAFYNQRRKWTSRTYFSNMQ